MNKRYLVEYRTYTKQRALFTQEELDTFLTVAVMHNKDITTFKVTDLDR